MWCYKFIYFAEYFFQTKCVATFAWDSTKRCKHFRDISLCSSVRSYLVWFGGLFGFLRSEVWFLGPNQLFGRFEVQFVLMGKTFKNSPIFCHPSRCSLRFSGANWWFEVRGSVFRGSEGSSFGILRFNPILLQSHTYLQLQNPHPLLLEYYNIKVFV